MISPFPHDFLKKRCLQYLDMLFMLLSTVYGKTFVVVHKTHYSLENFCGASGPCHYLLYTANYSRGKLSRLAKKLQKPRKFCPSKVLLYTVFCIALITVWWYFIVRNICEFPESALSRHICKSSHFTAKNTASK